MRRAQPLPIPRARGAPWPIPVLLLVLLLLSPLAKAQPLPAALPEAVALLAAERDLGTAAAAMLPPEGAGDPAGRQRAAGLYDAARGAFDGLIDGIVLPLERNEQPDEPAVADLARTAAAAREALLAGVAAMMPLEQRRQIARDNRVLQPDELATALPAALPALWATWQSSSPAQQQQLLGQLAAQRWPPLPPGPTAAP